MNLTQEQLDNREARIAKAKRHNITAEEALSRIDFSKESRTRQNAIRWTVKDVISHNFYNEEKMVVKEISFESKTEVITDNFKYTTRILSIKVGWKDTFMFDETWNFFIGRNGGVSTWTYDSKTRKTKQIKGRFNSVIHGGSKSLY